MKRVARFSKVVKVLGKDLSEIKFDIMAKSVNLFILLYKQYYVYREIFSYPIEKDEFMDKQIAMYKLENFIDLRGYIKSSKMDEINFLISLQVYNYLREIDKVFSYDNTYNRLKTLSFFQKIISSKDSRVRYDEIKPYFMRFFFGLNHRFEFKFFDDLRLSVLTPERELIPLEELTNVASNLEEEFQSFMQNINDLEVGKFHFLDDANDSAIDAYLVIGKGFYVSKSGEIFIGDLIMTFNNRSLSFSQIDEEISKKGIQDDWRQYFTCLAGLFNHIIVVHGKVAIQKK